MRLMRHFAKLLLPLLALTVSVNMSAKTIDDYGGYEYDFERDSIFYTIHDEGVYVSALRLSLVPRVVFGPNDLPYDLDPVMYHGHLAIPETVVYSDTVYRVTGIEQYAFKGCTELESVSIPSSIIYIGDFAFSECAEMETVNIQPGVTYIGENAFSHCSSLKEIVLPYGIESISDRTFVDCSSLTRIDIPGSVRSVGIEALYGCSSLRELNIPEGVKSLGNGMIEHCKNLKYLTIPESVENHDIGSLFGTAHTALAPMVDKPDTINLNLFEHRNHVRYVQGEITIYKKGIEYIHSLSFDILSLPANGLFKCIIGSDMDSIPDFFQGKEVFYSGWQSKKSDLLERMESLYISESVKFIGKSAFFGCPNLKEVVIGGNPVISESAFSGCDKLGKVALSSPVPPTVNLSSSNRIDLQAEAETGKRIAFSSDIQYVDKTFDLPEASGGKAWYLWSSQISKNITVDLEYDIPGWYDIYVTAVPNSMIPDPVDSNPMYIYATVEYRDSTGAMQTYYRPDPQNPRKQFKYVVDGYGIDTLHVGRVYLDNPTRIGFKRIVSIIVSSAVTNSNKDLYSSSLGLDCVMMELVSLAGPSADFTPEDKLEELDLSPAVRDSLTEAMCQTIFSRNVFYNALLSVPENAVSDYLNSMLWKHFNNMEGYVSGGYETDLGNDSIYFNLYYGAAFVAAREVSREKFRGIFGFDGPLTPRDPIAGGLQPRSPLRAIGRDRSAVPDGVHDSEGSAFYRGNITIPESVMFDNTTYTVSGIDYYAFMGCRELESVTIPESVTKLGYGSFAGCIGLNTIVLPSGVENIPDALFYGCIRLDNVIIPDGVDTIGHSAFYECTGLTEIVIPASVELIDEYAFFGCTGLKRIVIEGNPEIAPTAFLGCGTGLEIIKTGIESIDADHHEVYGPIHYGIDGRPVAPDAPGLHIIRLPDGRMKKALILWK